MLNFLPSAVLTKNVNTLLVSIFVVELEAILFAVHRLIAAHYECSCHRWRLARVLKCKQPVSWEDTNFKDITEEMQPDTVTLREEYRVDNVYASS